MMTTLRLVASLSGLIVSFPHCYLTCSNFRYTCWSTLHSSLHSKRRDSFWPWGDILLAVMFSSVYFKMHEVTLIWNKLFILWFLNALLLQWLQSWSNWMFKIMAEFERESTELKPSYLFSNSTHGFIREG